MEAVTPIPKIRAGNEFTFIWSISRDGVAENLTDPTITDLKLTVCVGGLCAERVEVPFTIVDTNKIRSSHLYERTGTYNLELTYKKAGVENEIDIEAFKIVSRSADASESSDFIVSSDMAIGFKGDSAYQVWLDAGNVGTEADYFAYLQQPAADMIASLNETNEAALTAEGLRTEAESIRLQNEQGRVTAESLRATAETTRQGNETDRQTAEGLRATAESARQTAEGLRVTAEQTRQTNTGTAIQNANTATGLANDAATNANTKAGLADTAANNANEKAGLADAAATNANTKAGLADAAATNANNVANTYAAELALKELKANKQNSLAADGTGTKFPTVDAVNAGLENSNLLATYVHSGNLEVAPTAVDLATGTFTKTAHGLINGDRISPIINIGGYVYPFNVYPSGLTNTDNGHYVVGVTPNTFQISLTSGGAPVTFTTNALMDLTKWHFEKIVFLDYNNANIKLTNSFKIVYSLRTLRFSNMYISVLDADKWIGTTTLPQTADVQVGITIPNSLIGMSHIGYAEQKYIASPNMSSIHMTARMFQTGTTLNKYSLKYADSIKVVNSNYIQPANFWIYGICPANGFSFNIYKL